MLGLEPQTWFPVVTLVVGILLKTLSDVMLERRKTAFEREIRREERSDKSRLSRAEFQWETLLDLQIRIADLSRCAGRLHVEDVRNYEGGNAWGSIGVSNDLNEKLFESQRQVRLLSVRVRNDEIRELSTELSGHTTAMVVAQDRQEADSILANAIDCSGRLNERIGEELRQLDDVEDKILR